MMSTLALTNGHRFRNGLLMAVTGKPCLVCYDFGFRPTANISTRTVEEPSKTWIFGREFDKALFDHLADSLKSLGYGCENETYGVAGSQELHQWEAKGRDGTLSISAETYMGLSVTGQPHLVDELRGEFNKIAISG